MLYLFALVNGFAYGGFSPSITALFGDTFGLRKIGAILGVLELGVCFGAGIGPAIGGLIFDISNSYTGAFLIGASGLLVSILLIALVRRETNRNSEGV